MSKIATVISIDNLYTILIDYLSYKEFFNLHTLFYKMFGEQYSISMLREQIILKNKCNLANIMLPLRMQFEAIPTWILYKLLDNRRHEMVSFLAKNSRLFTNLPQEILNKIVLDPKNYQLVCALSTNGISFMNLPQGILNQLVLTNCRNIVNHLISHGVSFLELPQWIKIELLTHNSRESIILILATCGGVSFSDIPQDVINFIVKQSRFYELIYHFVDIGISFLGILQEVLNEIVLCRKNYIIVSILGNSGVSFTDIPQEILNQIVSNGYCLMVANLVHIGVSFTEVPQEILHKILRNNNNELKEIASAYNSSRNIVSVLLDNGVSFTDLPQELINQIVTNSTHSVVYRYMLDDLRRIGVL